MRTRRWMILGSMLVYARWATAEDVTKTCQIAGWDMTQEIAAFQGSVTSVAAGATVKDAQTLTTGVLAQLTLQPQSNVQFAAPPERPAKVPMPLGGLAQFKVPTTSHYRITVDIPLWLDAVSASTIIPAGAFNGWHECPLFRKTVDYPLQAGQTVILQFSGAAANVVKVLIQPALAATTPLSAPPTSDAYEKVHALLKTAWSGNRDAQFNIAKLMRGCPDYARQDEARALIHSAFVNCARLWAADNVGTANEWLELATKAKQPQAMAMTATDLLRELKLEEMYNDTPRGMNPAPAVTGPTGDALDPRQLIREAITTNNPEVYDEISHRASLLFRGDPNALTLFYSWLSVACQRGLDCGKASDLAAFNCARNITECDNFKRTSDYPIWLASFDDKVTGGQRPLASVFFFVRY